LPPSRHFIGIGGPNLMADSRECSKARGFRLNGRWDLPGLLPKILPEGQSRPAQGSNAMAEAMMLEAGDVSRVWGSIGGATSRTCEAQPRHTPQPAGRPSGSHAWLTAEEIALMLLRGECAEAGVSPPARFAPAAVSSAIRSVQRWTEEGRIFAIHELYPRYQFDSRGRPHAPIEHALAALGRRDVLRVGNWFASPNPHLGGKRPQELIATAPAFVILAVRKIAAIN